MGYSPKTGGGTKNEEEEGPKRKKVIKFKLISNSEHIKASKTRTKTQHSLQSKRSQTQSPTIRSSKYGPSSRSEHEMEHHIKQRGSGGDCGHHFFWPQTVSAHPADCGIYSRCHFRKCRAALPNGRQFVNQYPGKTAWSRRRHKMCYILC